MSTQQDIYAAGSENCPSMLNKDNYVPWSCRIIRYARSRPNGKMIVDSIENGPYVRRMIATPGEPYLPVPVPESFHEQTDEELTETDIKRMDADDQAIHTILLGLPEDVYAAVDTCETAKKIWERINLPPVLTHNNHFQSTTTSLEDINDPTEAMNATLILFAKAFQLFARTNNNQRTSSNPRNRQIAQPVMNMGQDRQIQNVGGNGENQGGQYAGQVAQNQQGFNAWQNGGIQGAQNAGMQSGGNQNGLVVVPRIENQSGTGNVVAARAEGDLDEIEEVNANCILMANLQQASTSGTQHDKAPIYDTDGSANGTVETSSAPNEEICAHQETVYRNIVDQVAQVDMVNRNMRATNAELNSELARYKIQEQRVEIKSGWHKPTRVVPPIEAAL
nr:hypothetical protein [Tanacetum cinerariifolium]